MNEVIAEYAGEVKSESRKMQTTRGPGFTTLKQSYVIRLDPGDLKSRPSLEPALKRPLPFEFVDADSVTVEYGGWNWPASTEVYLSLQVTYQHRGHSKKADVGRKDFKRLRQSGADLSHFGRLVKEEVEAAVRASEAEEALRQVAWIASCIVTEARKEAKEALDYNTKLSSLRAALLGEMEQRAMSYASSVAREEGVDEAELRQAIATTLAKPPFPLVLG
jgi:hypothetical protein